MPQLPGLGTNTSSRRAWSWLIECDVNVQTHKPNSRRYHRMFVCRCMCVQSGGDKFWVKGREYFRSSEERGKQRKGKQRNGQAKKGGLHHPNSSIYRDCNGLYLGVYLNTWYAYPLHAGPISSGSLLPHIEDFSSAQQAKSCQVYVHAHTTNRLLMYTSSPATTLGASPTRVPPSRVHTVYTVPHHPHFPTPSLYR
jgi:hypothetical protein